MRFVKSGACESVAGDMQVIVRYEWCWCLSSGCVSRLVELAAQRNSSLLDAGWPARFDVIDTDEIDRIDTSAVSLVARPPLRQCYLHLYTLTSPTHHCLSVMLSDCSATSNIPGPAPAISGLPHASHPRAISGSSNLQDARSIPRARARARSRLPAPTPTNCSRARARSGKLHQVLINRQPCATILSQPS